MTAFRIAAQTIAHQPVKAIEILPHVRRAGCNINPRRRSKPEHRLHPVQHAQQALQCSRIESTAYFDPASTSQFNYKSTIAPTDAVDILRDGGNHFNGNKRPASRLPFTMNATPIRIQCRYRQSAINAKCLPRQPAGFIFRNQPLHLNPTTPPPYHSRFAHSSSPSRNSATRKGALLRRIRLTRHLRRSSSKAVMREGRTDSVRPRLADRLAAKDKTLPRVLDGDSAHPRTPGACCAWLQPKRPRAHFSFRRCFQV